ncbi:MAG: hypothetical protein CVV02_06335 [Firmicutes bacterium HGW-Firmicutes-7]|nr:MAG: hypothetical protein CVV02_06335 [Firmicutes bacterium HGW-Firmicutes-7]
MDPFIKLGFVGSYKVDMIHYLSRILKALNKEVILIDASEEQLLKTTLPTLADSDLFTYFGVDCISYSEEKVELSKAVNMKGYDIALVDHGLHVSERIDMEYSIVFIVTDYERHNILSLKKSLNNFLNNNMNVVKVYRDVIDTKINKNYINHILNIDVRTKVLAEYEFERTQEDYKCKLLCQYDEVFSFKKLSRKYKEMFADIIEELYGIEFGKVMKVIKAVEGAKACK